MATRGPTAVLWILNGAEEGRLIALTGDGPFTMGRGLDADIQLAPDDSSMSRLHALIRRRADTWILENLSSGTNAPTVNDAPRAQAELADGDEISLGKTRLKFSLTDPASLMRCAECAVDLADIANSDGRAIDLLGVSTYLCSAHAKPDPSINFHAEGNYRICCALGEGGAGAVYKAWNSRTGRVVALKRLLDGRNVEQVRRFDREITMLSRVRHPNIVRFIESDVDDEGLPYLVTELVPDGSLHDLARRSASTLPTQLAVNLTLQALSGLRVLHGLGLIHRDLKPKNVLVRRTSIGFVAKLADFGLMSAPGTPRVTQRRRAGGSFGFMPSEQLTDFSSVGPRADVYSMGATLYFLLAGTTPLDFKAGATHLEHLTQIAHSPRVPIRNRVPSLSPLLASIVDQACARDATDRFPTAEAFESALTQTL